MMLTRRSVAVGSAAVATTTALAFSPDAVATRPGRPGRSRESGQVLLDWERICFRTVYTDALTPVPVGVPILGFVSVAMNDAVARSAHQGASSESAAAARAAHDVLARYHPAPALRAKLAADLAATYAAIGPGKARARGDRAGAHAAREMIRRRRRDNYLNPDIHYTKTPGPGVWRPVSPATDMLGAWIGSLRPLVVKPFKVSDPYSLGSTAWAADYDEVKRLGSTGSVERTPAQSATSAFFAPNAAIMVGDALIRYLEHRPIGILATARLFAQVHTAMTDSFINCWRLKRDVGFWRPDEAISGQYDDGNAATTPEPGWASLLPTPNYSDYVSGHACATGPAVEVIREVLGETTQLELRSANAPDAPRTYARLSELEFDAFHSRIWGGLHFRKAMQDGYEIAHRTAQEVLRRYDR